MQFRETANLDALRSVAVLAVMIDHLLPTIEVHGMHVSSTLMALTTNIGQTGVLAFFVHTSLVLMGSLQRMAPQRSRFLTALHFYVRRAFRIYPLAIAVIVAVLVLGIPAMTWRPTPPITTTVIVANFRTGGSRAARAHFALSRGFGSADVSGSSMVVLAGD